MEVNLAVAADEVTQDEGGRISIHGIFTEVLGSDFPFVLPRVHVAVFCDANIAEVGQQKFMEIRLQNEDGHVLLSSQHMQIVPPPQRPGKRPTFNVIFPFQNIHFDEDGDYEFAVLVGGETKRTVPVYIHEPPQPDETE